MPQPIRPRRRLAPLAAALVLMAGAVLPVAASASARAERDAAATRPVPAGAAVSGSAAAGSRPDADPPDRRATQRSVAVQAVRVPTAPAVLSRPIPAGTVVPSAVAIPAAPVRVESKVVAAPAPSAGGSRTPAAPSYRGTNHVWIPSLGVSRSVSFFACSRNTALAHVVYRWGCAGTNNVYLMGHASSVFRPLHDAYVSGRLKAGMRVIYADGSGRVRTYAVQFWKVVAPDGDVGWAFAAQSRPSLTLQTCVGSNSEKRLVVRLVAVG